MPATVNGIGTHYYGKKNLLVRAAICKACQRSGALSSYDTRLWFVIFFIPVIPLGRKRIIDQCSSCTRHHVADADAFEEAKQLQTSAGFDQYRREPTADSALGLHGQLLGFHEFEQAAEFRRTATERFPRHAGLRVGLAAQLEEVSEYQAATEYFESALELEPDLPAAREGVARRKMAAGELDEARRLLDYAEAPGAGAEHDLSPIGNLADRYQQAGRHAETLELAAHLIRELPDIGRQHKFRAFVARSEKALGVTESILPERKHSVRGLLRAEGSEYPAWQRWGAILGLVLVILAIGFAANNEYIRRHRVINVVNATGQPVQVSIDGAPATTVATLGTLSVAEGRHHIKLSGAVDQSLDVELSASYWDRWFKKPAWILNPGGEAVLDLATLYYAENPRPSEHQVIAGVPFTTLPHIDYRFEAPPQSLDVGSKNGEVVKSALQWTQTNDAGAFLQIQRTDRAAAMNFAENRLRHNQNPNPAQDQNQDQLLKFYLGSANPAERPRITAFLKSGLDRRPIWVQWHRAYQHLAGKDAELIPYYDGLVAKEPKSGIVLYLRARIEPDPDRQNEQLHRAIEVDPGQPWPYFAQGRSLAARAQWDESVKAFEKARELHIDSDTIDDLIHTSRLARGDAKALVTEYRDRMAAVPTDFGTLKFLGDALAASGQADQIESTVAEWMNRMGPGLGLGSGLESLIPLVRTVSLYQAGKLEECDRILNSGAAPGSEAPMDMIAKAGGLMRAQVLLALGRTKEVADNQAFAPLWDDPWNAVGLSLALDLDGQAKEAGAWRERAAKELESRDHDDERAAKVLRATEPPSIADVEPIVLDASEKALLLASLGARFPAKRDEYAAAARRYNVTRTQPYQLILRATDDPKP